jgi:hypothetical protein
MVITGSSKANKHEDSRNASLAHLHRLLCVDGPDGVTYFLRCKDELKFPLDRKD